jgi:hypothetical protein
MRHFTSRQSVTFAVLLTAMLSAQSVSAQEYSALNTAIKYAEVAATVANKVTSQLNNFDAAVANIDLLLQEANVKRFDAEVAAAVAKKMASQLNNVDAVVAKIDLILQEANVKRFDESVKNAEQCVENSECF